MKSRELWICENNCGCGIFVCKGSQPESKHMTIDKYFNWVVCGEYKYSGQNLD